LFRGGEAVNLDAKGRLAVPTRYRDAIMDRCDGHLVLTVHSDRCLMLYPLPEWERLERRVAELPDMDAVTRELKLMLFGHATDREIDKNGRILIPPRLREFAGLEKRVEFLGQSSKFEIWNEESWASKCAAYVSGDDKELSDALRSLTL